MRALAIAMLLAVPLLAVVACGSNNANTPPAAPSATADYPGAPPGYPPPGYPPQGYPPPGAPPGYATAPPASYPPSAPATAAPLSTPGLLALPCQSDATCGFHHCNAQYGKCTFPCQMPTDCLTNNCVMGVCLPGGGS